MLAVCLKGLFMPLSFCPVVVEKPQSQIDLGPSIKQTNMLNSHESLGIAQIVFYVPIVPTAIWLFRRNGKNRPRMAWWCLIPFSLSTLCLYNMRFGTSWNLICSALNSASGWWPRPHRL